MPIEIDLLNLNEEGEYYLKALLSEQLIGSHALSLDTESYSVFSTPYPVKVEKKPMDTSKEQVTQAAKLKEEEVAPNYGWLQPIYSWGMAAYQQFWSLDTAAENPALHTPPLPNLKTDNPSPYGQRPVNTPKKKIDISLSHALLIKREGNDIRVNIRGSKALGNGTFGSVFDSPVMFRFNINAQSLQIVQADNIIKKIQGNNSSESETAVLSEVKHLQGIDPTTQMMWTQRKANNKDLIIQTLFSQRVEFRDYWIITKRLPGQSLELCPVDDYTPAQKFTIALSLIKELYGLHHPEAFGGVHLHNDIKPANIIVDNHFVGRYCDYGAATNRDEQVTTFTPMYSTHTGFYQVAKEDDDTHSLGLTLFQLFLDKRQIPKDTDRWSCFPKGKYEKLKKNYGKNIGLQSIKLHENKAAKFVSSIWAAKDVRVSSTRIMGLNSRDSAKLFDLLKSMRKKDPIDLVSLYAMLLNLAQKLPEFDDKPFLDINEVDNLEAVATL